MQNKVPYNIFKKWYKDIRNKVVEVKVDDIPADEAEKEPIPVVKSHKASASTDNSYMYLGALSIVWCGGEDESSAVYILGADECGGQCDEEDFLCEENQGDI